MKTKEVNENEDVRLISGAATRASGKGQAEDQESPLGSRAQTHAKVQPLWEDWAQRKVLPERTCRYAI